MDDANIFGRSRSGSAIQPDITIHPLLLNTSSGGNHTPSNQPRISRHPQRLLAGGPQLRQTIDDLISGGAVQLFQQIMHARGGTETIRLEVPAGAVVNFDREYLQHRRVTQGGFSAAIRVEPPPGSSDRISRELDPLLTGQRWAQEVKILNGDFVAERLTKLSKHVVLALLPAAVEAIRQNKEREEKERVEREETEARAKAGLEEQAVAETSAKAEERALPEADAATDTLVTTDSGPPGTGTPVVTMQMTQDELMEHAIVPESIDTDTDMVDVGTPADADSSPSVQPVESSSAPAASERITVLIHGSSVDITDTGIDPTFLEALPDDMREEVLNQHVRDQRAARVERPADSQISSEFLDALPPEIRAEIIQQEAAQRARAPAIGGPAEIDNATFFASLDPTLRQTVLMEQDEGFIQTLPSHILAEVGAYREDHEHSHRLAARDATIRGPPPIPLHANRKPVHQHDAIQLLDKAGIAVLVRLLFFPQVLKKTLLYRVLVNLCENARSRTELFNLLLSILQDGTGDLAAVDKSFAQMSVRNTKGATAKVLGKQKATLDYLSALALNPQSEVIPDLVVQRCLEALTFIVSSNEMSSLFFLTEHELPAGLRRSASKKGKGKEKQVPQTHYPIVLLLGLLDRQSLLKTPAIMESVVGLLATVTRPLASLKDQGSDADPRTSTSNGPAAAETERMQVTEGETTVAPQTTPIVEQPTAGALTTGE